MNRQKFSLSILAVLIVFVFTTVKAGAEDSWVYVVNQGDNTVSVIDAPGLKNIATIKLSGSGPYRPFPTPGGKFVYIPKTGSNDISLVDVESLEEVKVISTGESQPYAITFTFDGRSIYIVHLGSNKISVVDGIKREVVDSLELIDSPAPVLFNRRATRFYLGSRSMGGLSAIYTKSAETIITLPLEGGIRELRFTPDFRDVWVLGESSLTVVDVKKNKIIRSIPLNATNGEHYHMDMDPKGKRVYLAKGGDKTITVIDTRRHREVAKISLNHSLSDLAISHPDGRYLWVAGEDMVSAIDLSSNQESLSIPVGKGPQRIAFVTLRRNAGFACFQ